MKYYIGQLLDKEFASHLEALVNGGFDRKTADCLVREWEIGGSHDPLGVEITKGPAAEIKPIWFLTQNPDGKTLVYIGSRHFVYETSAEAEAAGLSGLPSGTAWAVFSWNEHECQRIVH